MMKLICISDTHCRHRDINVPEGDVLICAGDFTHTGKMDEVKDFVNWFSSQSHKVKILVAGNHELTLDQSLNFNGPKSKRYFKLNRDVDKVLNLIKNNPKFIYLQHDWVEIYGKKIFGTPYVPLISGSNYKWAFEVSEKTLGLIYSGIPDDVDVLISHTPAYGTLDEYNGIHLGSRALKHAINRIKPKALVCGHIHSGYGQKHVNNVLHVNCSQVDGDDYEQLRSPQVLELS